MSKPVMTISSRVFTMMSPDMHFERGCMVLMHHGDPKQGTLRQVDVEMPRWEWVGGAPGALITVHDDFVKSISFSKKRALVKCLDGKERYRNITVNHKMKYITVVMSQDTQIHLGCMVYEAYEQYMNTLVLE